MGKTTIFYEMFSLELYLVLILVSAAVWLIRFRLKRRRLVELINKMKMPKGYPMVGHVFMFVYAPLELLNKVTEYFFEYGPNFAVWIFHIPLVVVGKPEDLETVMQSRYCIEKSFFYDFTKETVGLGLFTAPAEKWKKFRKLIQPTFHTNILRNFLTLFAATSGICVDEILPKYEKKKDVDWLEIFTRTSLDTLCKSAMGIDTDAQRKTSEFGYHLHRGMNLLFRRMTNILLYPKPIFKLTNTYRELEKSERFMEKFTFGVLIDKKQKLEQGLNDEDSEVYNENAQIIRKPFLELLLTLDNNGVPLTNEEIRDEIVTLFVGGTDTTSATTCSFLTMMGMYQDIQQKAYEEIISVLGPDRAIEMEDLGKLNYMERCLKETLRLFPPVPFISRKVCEKEVELSDCTLPVGANLIFPLYYTHRAPEYWSEPLKFDPDRFLPKNFEKQHPYSYVPFSGGMRNCIGLRYANMNLQNLHCMILRKYRIYSDIKSIEDINFIRIMARRPADGFKFYLERRK